MSQKKTPKKRTRKKQQNQLVTPARAEKSIFYLFEGKRLQQQENYEKALTSFRKAIRFDHSNTDAMREMIILGAQSNNDEAYFEGTLLFYESGLMPNESQATEALLELSLYLAHEENYNKSLQIAQDIKDRLESLNIRNPAKFRKRLMNHLGHLEYTLNSYVPPKQQVVNKKQKKSPDRKPQKKGKSSPAQGENKLSSSKNLLEPDPDSSMQNTEGHKPGFSSITETLPEIPLVLNTNGNGISSDLEMVTPASIEEYNLVLDAIRLRFKETFDHLLCLGSLDNITSLAYQEETARKVLKTFRGRGLLADEVGMGKTIEACMVIKEYMMRGMVKNVLVLTPTPLVSQWRQELGSKFYLDFRSTDDPDFRGEEKGFWQAPRIVASINTAKSKKHFPTVTGRDWDLVIIDEAHHLKNRNTLNWKLANTLKKRFLLLLTATPVENNLMELYNLITLLKPGQLKTASAFKEEFMTRGDPTDPKNRARLRGLLDQVMIRNTRAVANIHIPPRFAETIRIHPTKAETELYARISWLVRDIYSSSKRKNKMMLKHILAMAGSSPAALKKALSKTNGNDALFARHKEEMGKILELSDSMVETGKNKAVLDLIEKTSEKVIIFVQYRATLDYLSDIFQRRGIKTSLFHGSMPNPEKDQEIEKFKNDNNVLLTTELGGEGRNLQFCHRMINYDLPWNPMRIEQRIGRIHRIGQENQVLIYNLCAADTIEDYILEILDKKINMFELVVGEIDMIVGRMRDEQDFSDIVYDIWVNSDSEDERKAGFDKLGSKLKRCKTGYEKTRVLDDKLFGENFEI
ncbi:MAG: SNF2-related protein [Desulfonatronovibrio sp.]